MHVMVWRMWRARRQRRFVHLQDSPVASFAFQDVTKLGAVRRSNWQLFEGINCRRHLIFLRCRLLGLKNRRTSATGSIEK